MMTRLVLFIVAGVILAATASAEVPRPNADRVSKIEASLPERPGMTCPDASDRSAWGKYLGRPDVADRIRETETILAQEVPAIPDELYLECKRNGNRTRCEKVYWARIENLSTLMWAEVFECRGHFLQKIVDYLEEFCNTKSWVMPAHDLDLQVFNGTRPYIDLGAASHVMCFARVIALLGDKLPQGTVARLRHECDRRVFDTFLKANADPAHAEDTGNWWYYVKSNWNAVCNACVVRAALAMIEDRHARAVYAESAERTQKFFLDSFADDGYCLEGIDYWNFGYGHYLLLGIELQRQTRGEVNLFADPRAKRILEYAYTSQVSPGRGLPFADGAGNPDLGRMALGREVWPDVCNSTVAKRPTFLVENMDETIYREFGSAVCDYSGGTDLYDTLPVRTVFEDAQVWILRDRQSQRTNPIVLAFKGGHNQELHNHNDVGSYAVYLGNDDMAVDPGSEVYTSFTFSERRYESQMLNSWGHDVPVVGGALQSVGRKFAAKIVRQEFSDERDRVILDLTGAYDCTNLVSLLRTFVRDRQSNTVTVADKVEFRTPDSFEVPIVTYADVCVDYDPSKFALAKGKDRRMDVEVGTRGGSWKWRRELVENPTRVSPRRLAVVFDRPVAQAIVSFTFREGKSK